MRHPSNRSASRCQYRNAADRQCRSAHFGAASTLCPRHALDQQRNSDLTELFTLAHDKFLSPAGIHASLSELFTLLAENRVAPRRAAVLAYISSLLLRTLPAIQQEVAGEIAAPKNVPPTIIWNIPRPSHERHDTPPPTVAVEREASPA